MSKLEINLHNIKEIKTISHKLCKCVVVETHFIDVDGNTLFIVSSFMNDEYDNK